MLGPNLLCILAIVFLSATVIKATINKTGTTTNYNFCYRYKSICIIYL